MDELRVAIVPSFVLAPKVTPLPLSQVRRQLSIDLCCGCAIGEQHAQTLGIKNSERHLILKYRSGLHQYIRTKMDFLKISSLGSSYRYVVKIKEKF